MCLCPVNGQRHKRKEIKMAIITIKTSAVQKEADQMEFTFEILTGELSGIQFMADIFAHPDDMEDYLRVFNGE